MTNNCERIKMLFRSRRQYIGLIRMRKCWMNALETILVVLCMVYFNNASSFVMMFQRKYCVVQNQKDGGNRPFFMNSSNKDENVVEEEVVKRTLEGMIGTATTIGRVVPPAFVSTLKDDDEEVKALSIMDAAAELTRASKGGAMLGTVKSLGIDYGLVRTGIAVTVGYDPKPLTILSSVNGTQLCLDILNLVRQERVSQIVLGLPLHKNGTIAEQTHLTMDFARNLTRSVYQTFGQSIPVYLWDERYSSKLAQARMDSNKQQQLHIDADAACIILEHYYADDGKGAKTVQISPEEQQIWDEEWKQTLLQKQKDELNYQQQRQTSLNAKQMAMEKVRRLEEEQSNNSNNGDDDDNTTASFSKKKKKKKKKKKPNSNLLSNNAEKKTKKKWITL